MKRGRCSYHLTTGLLLLASCSRALSPEQPQQSDALRQWLVENEPWEWMFEGIGLAAITGLLWLAWRWWGGRAARKAAAQQKMVHLR